MLACCSCWWDHSCVISKLADVIGAVHCCTVLSWLGMLDEVCLCPCHCKIPMLVKCKEYWLERYLVEIFGNNRQSGWSGIAQYSSQSMSLAFGWGGYTPKIRTNGGQFFSYKVKKNEREVTVHPTRSTQQSQKREPEASNDYHNEQYCLVPR